MSSSKKDKKFADDEFGEGGEEVAVIEAVEEIPMTPVASRKKTQDRSKVSHEKSQEAARKHQEFFGSTIFDEEEKESKDEPMDDDILNVPAFFRRKK